MVESRDELSHNDVDARRDGGKSGGGALPEPAGNTGDTSFVGGQTDPACRGDDNDNAARRGAAKPSASTASGFVAGG